MSLQGLPGGSAAGVAMGEMSCHIRALWAKRASINVFKINEMSLFLIYYKLLKQFPC